MADSLGIPVTSLIAMRSVIGLAVSLAVQGALTNLAGGVLLLDEITANLDAETEKAVLGALKRVSANRTVLSISHRVTAETGRIISIGSQPVS